MKTLLIHGLGQTAAAWDKAAGFLPQGSFDAPELSALIGSGTYQELYRGFTERCLSEQEPLCLCGLSLGAVLALNFAAEHPDRVSALMLIAPQYKMPRALLKFQSAVFRLMPQSAFSGSGFSKEIFLKLTGSMAELDFTPVLKSVTCPTVIACGERDKTNRKAAVELVELLPDAEYAVIPGAGHEANTDAPETTAELIKTAISRR